MMPVQSRAVLHDRVERQARIWQVAVDRVVETDTSVLAFGRRDEGSVVLKVVREPGDEWFCGQVIEAFAGNGVVRVLDHAGGAVLLERLIPGTSLASMFVSQEDDQATAVVADIVARMAPGTPGSRVPSVSAWAQGFDRYLATGDRRVSRPLVESARAVFLHLCASQSAPRLLHGDLHHGNVLLDANRGWLAIDPKGAIGEIEFEFGAALRNPCERPELFTAETTIERRVARYSNGQRNAGRILGWAFAQAVLATLWELEDSQRLEAGKGWIALADRVRPMLRGVADA
jgi:streptomycin 6-kinase